jgi:cytoskeletal protein CcmA (bactofilin family)
VWKKKESELPVPESMGRTESPAPKPAPAQRRSDRAIIGPTLKIQGEVSGEEDLLIQGQIDGKISVKGQSVTIGKSGKVQADIHAKIIRVEGRVRGDLFGLQEIVIEASGDVEGNLVAPSVRLENGSRFKGSIDMESARQPVLQPAVPQSGPSDKSDDRATKPSPAISGQPARRS